MAIDSAGSIYIIRSGRQIHKIVQDTSPGTSGWLVDVDTLNLPSVNGIGFDGPSDIAVDKMGNVYVTDKNNHRVDKFSSDGKFVTLWGSRGEGDGQLHAPGAVAVDSAGNVYVSDLEHRVQKFTSSGEFILKWDGVGGQLAIDNADNVYVLDWSRDCVEKYTSTGTLIAEWSSRKSNKWNFDDLQDIAVDSKGNVYVTDRGETTAGRIQIFSPDGTLIASWKDKHYIYSGVAVDQMGNIYISQVGSTQMELTKYSPSGSVSSSATKTQATMITTTSTPTTATVTRAASATAPRATGVDPLTALGLSIAAIGLSRIRLRS